MTPAQRDLVRVTGEAAVRLSEALYILGWAVHHRAAQIETWGLQMRAKGDEVKWR